MKIIVLNGSPKGKNSVSLEYVQYIKKHFLAHEYEIINAAVDIHKFEKNPELFAEAIAKVKASDAVIWVFPVYFLLVASQYKRFIELIWERGLAGTFTNKTCVAISTSIHFFDDTSHNYIHEIANDLGMKYVGGYSAEMYDLMKSKERKRLLAFANTFFAATTAELPTLSPLPKVTCTPTQYAPSNATKTFPIENKKLLILVDELDMSSNVGKMATRLAQSFDGSCEIVSLADIDIKGGCTGCCVCGLDNNCFYRDGYKEFYNTKYKSADAIIYAGNIKDRFLSAKWKQFFDRSFFNGHVPTLIGKQMGFLVSGALSQNSNLRVVLNAYVGFQDANLVDIVSDETIDGISLDEKMENFAALLAYSVNSGYVAPANFLAIGGKKIFRDEIYGKLRFVFQADNRYYASNGFYDFPQKKHKIRQRNVIMILLTKIPAFRKYFLKKIVPEMVAPLRHVVEKK